jgi:hypothetical protein
MNRLLLTVYVLLMAWTVGAFAWIGKEMVEQDRIMGGIKALREGDSGQAEQAVVASPTDAPLYLVQELQQEPYKDIRFRLATVLEKAVGRSPKPLDPGNVFTPLSNEVKTAEYLADNRLEGVDTKWLPDSLRSRIRLKWDAAAEQWVMQLVMTPEEQKEIVRRVKEEAGALFPNLPERERSAIQEQAAYFVTSRWTAITKEREDRICSFLESFIRLHLGGGSPEEKEKLINLLVLNLRSRGEDLSAAEKEWLAEHLAGSLGRILPGKQWKEAVLRVARDYALYGWAPLIEEEAALLQGSLKLHAEYGSQRKRFAEATRASIRKLVDQGGDVNRVLVTEMVSLLGDRNAEVTRPIADALVILAEARMKHLADTLATGQTGASRGGARPESGPEGASATIPALDEPVKVAYQPTKDIMALLKKTLHREQVPSVMAVQTRAKTKDERKQELERLLRSARVQCAHTLGSVALAGIRQGATIASPEARELFHELIVSESRKALQGILGSANPNVVAAAQEELKRIQAPALP